MLGDKNVNLKSAPRWSKVGGSLGKFGKVPKLFHFFCAVSLSDLKVFFKLQKMCVCHILGAGYRSHTDPPFASNKILKIKDLVKYKLLTIAHQAFYASCPFPTPVMNLFCISEPPNRNKLFKFSQHDPVYGKDYISNRIPKLWSLEDLDLWNVVKLEAIKSVLYSRLVEGYSKEISSHTVSRQTTP